MIKTYQACFILENINVKHYEFIVHIGYFIFVLASYGTNFVIIVLIAFLKIILSIH